MPTFSNTISNYQLTKKLGKGTFSQVYQATHTPTGEPVAIKVLKKKHIKDIIDIERVSRELHILKTVNHQNLIGLYEIIETKNTIYIVMELCKEELFDYIVRNKKLSEQESLLFFL